jgi:hypothetical protein
MIIRIASAVSCLALVLAGASVANAQTFKPNGASFTIVDSYFDVQQSQLVTGCNINGFNGAVSATGSNATIDVGPAGSNNLKGPGLCPLVGLNSSDWVIVPTGATVGGVTPVSIQGVRATSLLGTCNVASSPAPVNLTGSFSGNTLTIPWQSMPGVILGSPATCYVGGDATTDIVTLTTP